MLRPYLLGSLLLCLSISGCHVVDKSRQCSALSAVLEKAGKDINTSFTESPSVAELESKAAQYQALATQIKALVFSEKVLAKQREELAYRLSVIEKELGNAAKARKELSPAGSKPSGPDEDSTDTSPANTDAANSNAAPDNSETSKKVAASPSGRPSQAPPAKEKSKTGSLAPEKIGKRNTSPRMNKDHRRVEAAKRRYAQAARAIDASNTEIKTIVKRIDGLCRD